MTAHQDCTISLLPNNYFYIYNYGNNHENIFFKQDNYRFFLFRYNQYLSSLLDTLAWTLLDNSFHLLVKFRSDTIILEASKEQFKRVDKTFVENHVWKYKQDIQLLYGEDVDLTSFKNLLNLVQHYQHSPHRKQNNLATELAIWIISQQVRRFLMSYSKAINKQQKRTGSLFQKPFRRRKLDRTSTLRNHMAYIHHLPIRLGQVTNFNEYDWSSYNQHIYQFNDNTQEKSIIQIFSSQQDYIHHHQNYKYLKATP